MLISVTGNKKLWLLFFETICQKNSWGSPLRTWKDLYVKNQKIVKDYTVTISFLAPKIWTIVLQNMKIVPFFYLLR